MKHCKVAILLLLSILMLASLMSFTIFSQQDVASYEMYINNQKVGVVKYAAKGLSYYDIVLKQLKQQYSDDAVILAEVRFKEAKGTNPRLTSEFLIANAIEQAIEVQILAYAVNINGETLCYLESLEEGMQAAESVKKPYVDEIQGSDSQLQNVGFSENLQFEPITVAYEKLATQEEAVQLLQQSSEGVIEHSVLQGETLWNLSIEKEIDVEEILALNPDLDPEKIKPGDTIILSAEKKLLTVTTEETLTSKEDIPFETENRDDNTLLRGQTKKVQEGKRGSKEVQVRIFRENGKEISREVIKETVVEEPTKEIIAVGTKRPPTPTQPPSRSGSTTSSSNPTTSTPAPNNPPPSNGSVTGNDVVNYARQFLGKPYNYGGNGPNSFDCSGFTSYVYRHFGYSLNRSSRAQVSNGVAVSKSNLAAGDLVLFNNGSSIGHVGIYIGNGDFIHASTYGVGVTISNINKGSYPSRYNSARRILR